jgi:flagellar assembly protein FliH
MNSLFDGLLSGDGKPASGAASGPSHVPRSGAKGAPFLNVPPPQGSKGASAYQRFIPREELGSFATWRPGEIGGTERRAQPGRADRHPAGAAPGAAGSGAAAAATQPAREPTPAEWLAQLNSERQAARQAGHQAGYKEGYRDGTVALDGFKQSFAQQTTAQVGALLDAFETQFAALDADLARALADTAVQLARQVLRTELHSHPQAVAAVASEAVNAMLHSARHITVHLHPQDLPLVAAGSEETLAARGARLQADSSIARGGVLVRSDVGTVDARVSTRWQHAVASLGSSLPWQDDAA